MSQSNFEGIAIAAGFFIGMVDGRHQRDAACNR